MTTIIPTDEEHGAMAEKVKSILSDQQLGNLKKQLEKMLCDVAYSLWSDVELQLCEDVAFNLSGTAQRMAERFVTAVLEGDEKAAKQAFTLGQYYTGREYLGIPPMGDFFESEVIAMRRKLVEAHRDLLSNARIEDLEAQLKGRDAEIDRLKTKLSQMEQGA